jgi:hypothetical protein
MTPDAAPLEVEVAETLKGFAYEAAGARVFAYGEFGQNARSLRKLRTEIAPVSSKPRTFLSPPASLSASICRVLAAASPVPHGLLSSLTGFEL